MMSCEQWNVRLGRWLEQRWESETGAAELPELLSGHAAECPRCAARLEAALLLLNGKALRSAPSAGLAGRIAADLQTAGPGRQSRPRLRTWQRWAALPVAAALVAAVTFFLTTRLSEPSAPDTVIVRLVLEAPEAMEVSVVGDWNGWDPTAHPLLDRNRDGVWEIELRLKRGQEHQYQFLIDHERWVPDPGSPLRVEDGFGGFNSILQI